MSSSQKLIGIGVDSVSWARIERFLSDHSPEFAERILSPSERKSFRSTSRRLRFFTRSLVAKEAYFKASGGFWLGGEAGFREIEIRIKGERFRVRAPHRKVDGHFFETPDGMGARAMIWASQ